GAAHRLGAEVGRVVEGVGDQLEAHPGWARAEYPGELEHPGDPAGVVVGAGEAAEGIVVGPDHDALLALGAESGDHVPVGVAVRGVGLTAHLAARGAKRVGDVLGGGVEVLQVLAATREKRSERTRTWPSSLSGSA